MILFFRTPSKSVIATEIDHKPSPVSYTHLTLPMICSV